MGVPDPASNNALITEAFGVNANPATIVAPIPNPSQVGTGANIASFNDGFPIATMTPVASGGEPMRGPDMNGILYMLSACVAALEAGQLEPFNATRASAISGYAPGAVLATADGTGIWINLSGSGNTANPDTTSSAGWGFVQVPGPNITLALTNANVVLTPPQYKKSAIFLQGALTSNVAIIFPGIAGMIWTVYNQTSGNYSVTCRTASGSGVVIPQISTRAFLIGSDAINIVAPFNPLVPSATISQSATCTGFSSAPTVTITASINGDNVSGTITGFATGTSSLNTMTITNWPAAIIPVNTKTLQVEVIDNNNVLLAQMLLQPGGGLATFSPYVTNAVTNRIEALPTAFTPSGNKGFGNTSFSYSLSN